MERFRKLTAEQKKRLVLVCTCIFAFLLTLSVIMPLVNQGRGRAAQRRLAEPERIFLNLPIPAGDLFLPDEPDFIPEILLQRERRTIWTEEDAEEFWQDPLMFGEQRWRENIEAAIDELLERVP